MSERGEVTRYRIGWNHELRDDFVTCEFGEFVRYDDYAALRSQLAAVTAALKATEEEASSVMDDWKVAVGLLDEARDLAHEQTERAEAAERERDEARREREDYKAMYLDLWDAAKRHETEREALRHRAERAERVVKALREPSDAVIDALRTHIYQYALTNSLDMAHGLRAAVEAADCATPTPEPTP